MTALLAFFEEGLKVARNNLAEQTFFQTMTLVLIVC
jgi:hypothetical protein